MTTKEDLVWIPDLLGSTATCYNSLTWPPNPVLPDVSRIMNDILANTQTSIQSSCRALKIHRAGLTNYGVCQDWKWICWWRYLFQFLSSIPCCETSQGWAPSKLPPRPKGQYYSEVRKGHVSTFPLHTAMEFKPTCFLDAPAQAKGEKQAAAVF